MSADLFSVLCFSSSSTDYHRNQLMNHTDERCEIWRFVNPQLTWPAICSDHTCVHHRSCSFLDISITLHHAFQAINFKWCVCFIFRPPGAIGFTDNRKGNINRQKNFKNSNQKVWLNSVCVFFFMIRAIASTCVGTLHGNFPIACIPLLLSSFLSLFVWVSGIVLCFWSAFWSVTQKYSNTHSFRHWMYLFSVCLVNEMLICWMKFKCKKKRARETRNHERKKKRQGEKNERWRQRVWKSYKKHTINS